MPQRPKAVLGLTATAYFMVVLDALVVVTALPRIGAQLHAGLPTLQWTVNSYGIAVAAGIITAAAVGDRIGRRRVFIAGLLLQAAGFGWVAGRAGSGLGYPEMAIALLIAGIGGIGISMALPTAPTAVMGAVDHHEIGTASGVASTMQRFGAVFTVAIATAVFTGSGHFGSPHSVIAGFRPALGVCAGLSLLGALAALGLKGGTVRLPQPQVAEVTELPVSDAQSPLVELV